jgi:hypothetical protein
MQNVSRVHLKGRLSISSESLSVPSLVSLVQGAFYLKAKMVLPSRGYVLFLFEEKRFTHTRIRRDKP